jgi:hypothetical protein
VQPIVQAVQLSTILVQLIVQRVIILFLPLALLASSGSSCSAEGAKVTQA